MTLTDRSLSAASLPPYLANATLVFSNELDIDDDGVVEHVFVWDEDGVQRMSVFDASMEPIEYSRDSSAFWDDEELSGADTIRLMSHDGAYYVIASRGGALSYATRLVQGREEIVCEFERRATPSEMPTTHVLSTYESLLRLAKSRHVEPWEYALSLNNLAGAETLLAHGHSPNDHIHGETLLNWAISHAREELAHWLVQSGADVRTKDSPSNAPLYNALLYGQTGLAIRLIQRGADPSEVMWRVEDTIRRQHDASRPLVDAVIDRLQRIPEGLVVVAVREAPTLLDSYLKSGLPVESGFSDWQAGRKQRISFWVRGAAFMRGDVDVHRKLKQLYGRATIAPGNKNAVASYGTFEEGIAVIRYPDSRVSDEEFLLFATSICTHFLAVDCGSEALVRQGRSWAEQLAYDCPEKLRQLHPTACKVAMRYADLGNRQFDQAVLIAPVSRDLWKRGSGFLNLDDLKGMYLKKMAMRQQ